MNVHRFFTAVNGAAGLVAFSLLLGCAETLEDCEAWPLQTESANAGCLIVDEGRLLMVQQRVNGTWSLPGGTAKPGERAVCTAIRETREETGYQVNVVEELVVFYNGFYLYACEVVGNPKAKIDAMEITAVQWQNRQQRQDIPWRYEQQRQQIEQLIEQVMVQAPKSPAPEVDHE